MTENKLIELIQKIEKKTAQKSVDWEKTASENEFQATLSTFVIRIRAVEDSYARSTDYILSIINSDGIMLESVNDGNLATIVETANAAGATEFKGFSAYRAMESIFTNARRRALGVERAIDDILSELN